MTRPYPLGGADRAGDDEAGGPVVLGGRYELTELLGTGGMAEVHRAHDRSLNRVVAVKLLLAERREDLTDARRLQDEARAAAGLSHRNVVAVHDVGSSPQGVYVVMELLAGRTWRDELRDRGRLPESEVARVGAAVASALAEAHAHGIIHRDVNPANVMLLDDGTPKLMDFGIARIEELGGLTETGQVVGTAAYMSPEQVCGEQLDGRSDVYSLGCAIYEAVTATTPFRGRGSADVAAARLRDRPVPPRQVVPGLSVGLEDIVLRTMARDADDRPDAAALAAALTEIAERAAGGTRTLPPEDRTTTVLPAGGAAPGGAGPAPGRDDGAGPPERRRDRLRDSVRGRDTADTADTGDGPPGPDAPPVDTGFRWAGVALVVLGVMALVVVLALVLLGQVP